MENKILPDLKLIEDLLLIHTMTLATTDLEGNPHAAPVYFAADQDLNLYFFSGVNSQHGKDLKHSPRSAVAIYGDSQDWKDIRGLQMRGEAYLLEPGRRWDLAWSVYRTKFPFVTALKIIVAQNELYAFIPSWMRLVDNHLGFGFKQEWTLK
jgi:hypothetical protein